MGRPIGTGLGRVTIGLDVGQRKDPTAIAVVQAEDHPTGRRVHGALWHKEVGEPGWGECSKRGGCYDEAEDLFVVRTLGRLPLGTKYPAVSTEVVQVVRRLNEQGTRPHVRVDVTGVGRPVFDDLAHALADDNCFLQAVTFTATDRIAGAPSSSELRVGKEWMVSRLQVLLANRRVVLPSGHKQSEALARELETYEVRISDDARYSAGAFRTGAHDDLATALGLACLFESDEGRPVKVPTPYR